MIIKGININIIIDAILITIVIAIGIVSVSCEKEDNMSERFLLLTAHSWEHDTIFTICQNP